MKTNTTLSRSPTDTALEMATERLRASLAAYTGQWDTNMRGSGSANSGISFARKGKTLLVKVGA
jgi:hypothetical protein